MERRDAYVREAGAGVPLVCIPRALDVPTLCLVGSDSPASSRSVARLLAKTLPRVIEVEIEGVGHMGPVTHSDRINALIDAHLEQLTVGCVKRSTC